MHAELAPVLEAARAKGVDLGLPTDFEPDRTLFYSSPGFCDERGDLDAVDGAAALIVTGALSKWLAGRGIAVCQMWNGGGVSWFMYRDGGHGWSPLSATDHLSALLAATLARLDELPDKEKA